MSIITSSTKHQLQVSPGSSEVMIGCCVARKCFVACLFFESSQQPTCPQVRQRRRCTHVSPAARHSSQPAVLGLFVTTKLRWSQFEDTRGSLLPRQPVATSGHWLEA